VQNQLLLCLYNTTCYTRLRMHAHILDENHKQLNSFDATRSAEKTLHFCVTRIISIMLL